VKPPSQTHEVANAENLLLRTDGIGVDQRGSNHRLRVKYIIRQAPRRDVGRKYGVGSDAAKVDAVGLACEPLG
jgi:hypothetical protein